MTTLDPAAWAARVKELRGADGSVPRALAEACGRVLVNQMRTKELEAAADLARLAMGFVAAPRPLRTIRLKREHLS